MDIPYWVGRGFIAGIIMYIIGQLVYSGYAGLKKRGIIDEWKFHIKKYMEDRKNARKSKGKKGNDRGRKEERTGEDRDNTGINREATQLRSIQAGTAEHTGGDSSTTAIDKPEHKQDSIPTTAEEMKK